MIMSISSLILTCLTVFGVTITQGADHCLTNTTTIPLYRVTAHNCTCNTNTTGTLRYDKKILEICNGIEYVNVCSKMSTLGASEDKPASSCLEILDKNRQSQNGIYYLNVGGAVIKAYCYMDEMCGSRGWTMIMKVNGAKSTFHYASPYWTNKATYNTVAASGGLDDQETKLETYSTFPFTFLCLGMKTENVTNWMSLKYPAHSLHSLIGDNKYRKTSQGRDAWKSLITGSSLQNYCNLEGFNARVGYGTMARIGILGNNEKDCKSPDSRLGFGTGGNRCGQDDNNSAGNEGHCASDNGEKSIKSFSYIFAQSHLGDATLGYLINPAKSCEEIKLLRSDASSGQYYLSMSGNITKVYCHMDVICNSSGWTMIMKIDGEKQTFSYDSKYWTSDETYNVEAISQGIETRQEMKLQTYSIYPVRRICLGMKVNDEIHWISLKKQDDPATLYSVISTNNYSSTNLGRDVWTSLIPGSVLHIYCNREGFNVNVGDQWARIGILSNEHNNCNSSTSRIGFGTKGPSCQHENNTTSEKVAGCNSDQNMGFILAQ